MDTLECKAMRLLSLLFVCITASAQTTISIGQMSCPASTSPQILVAIPLGSIGSIPIIRLTCAVLDPATLILDTTRTPPVLRAVAIQAPGTNYVDGEVPTGLMDGANSNFTLASTPIAGSLHLHRNGVRQKSGLDYNLVGISILFLAGSTPQPGDTLLVDYRK